MSQFSIVGRVPQFNSNEFYLRVENDKELEKFFEIERIDTKLGYAGNVNRKLTTCDNPILTTPEHV